MVFGASLFSSTKKKKIKTVVKVGCDFQGGGPDPCPPLDTAHGLCKRM